jgi:hypothetical protein
VERRHQHRRYASRVRGATESALSERTVPVSHLQVGQHLGRCERYLLAKPFGHNRDIYEGEQIVGIRT